MSDDTGHNYLIETEDPSALVASYQERRRDLVDWLDHQVKTLPQEMSPDDMGRKFKQLQISGNLYEDVHLATRFLMGEAARRVRGDTEYGNIGETLKRLAEKFRLGNTRTLRQCIQTAETFHGNAQLFGRWLLSGEKKRWGDFVKAGKANVDPRGLSEEAFETWLEDEINNVEQAAERAESAAAEIDPDDEQSIREMDGVVTMLTHEAEHLRTVARKVWDEEGPESDQALDAYLDWIHSMPCLACGTMGETEAHHVQPSVTAKKQSHWFRVPLCHDCHMTLEDHDHDTFKKRTGFDIRELTARTLHLFIAGDDARFPTGLD